MSKALARRGSTLPANVLADRVVMRLREAEKALQAATTIHQAKLVADVASAQEVFAQRQKLGDEVIGYAHQIKIYALAKLGDLIIEMPKATGTRGQLRGTRDGSGGTALVLPEHDAAATYAELGLDRKTASVAQQLAALPAATRDAIANKELTLAKAQRATRSAAVQQRASLPAAKFRVIVADPPWTYGNAIDEAMPGTTVAETHYPCMTIKDLCAMPIEALCEPDAVLFLWVTSPLLFEAVPVVKAWGFAYKTSFVWDKVKHNVGFYNSVRHEFLLVCTRGSGVPDNPKLFDSVVVSERTAHSVKPNIFYEMIDTLYTHGKKLELFGRRPRKGWVVYGNEIAEEPE